MDGLCVAWVWVAGNRSLRCSVLGIMQVQGDVTYNGRKFDEFVPLRTATYVEQSDTVSSLL